MTQAPPLGRIDVRIANQQSAIVLDRRLLRRAVAKVLRTANLRKAQISLAVVDDEAIAQLNWRFLCHRGPADVLSFRLDDCDRGARARAADAPLEGEVIVSAETAARSAADYGWSPHDELLLYVVHGTLHLVGYDDRTSRQRAQMQRMESAVLRELGIERR